MSKIKLLILSGLVTGSVSAMNRQTPNSTTPAQTPYSTMEATPAGMILPISATPIGDGFEEDAKSAPIAPTTDLADAYSKGEQLQIIEGSTTADAARFFFAASPSLELDSEVATSFAQRLSPDNLGNASGLQKQLIAARFANRQELQDLLDAIKVADQNGTGEIARQTHAKRIKQLRQLLS